MATTITLLLATLVVQAQAPQQAATVLAISSSSIAPDLRMAEQRTPVREVDDPQTGARWLLYASSDGGPGKLVLVQPGIAPSRPSGVLASHTAATSPNSLPLQLTPVIRGGDRVVLEEHTPVVDALLEGVALTPARQGATLRVRLKIGGAIVQAVALGPGRAAFAPLTESRP